MSTLFHTAGRSILSRIARAAPSRSDASGPEMLASIGFGLTRGRCSILSLRSRRRGYSAGLRRRRAGRAGRGAPRFTSFSPYVHGDGGNCDGLVWSPVAGEAGEAVVGAGLQPTAQRAHSILYRTAHRRPEPRVLRRLRLDAPRATAFTAPLDHREERGARGGAGNLLAGPAARPTCTPLYVTYVPI